MAPFAAVDGVQQRMHGAGSSVWVVFGWVAKNVGNQRFKFRFLFGPEHGGGIAHLNALGRILAQQVVQRRGIGK